MPSDPYDDWTSIYNDEIRAKWESEKVELRKVAMIYCAFEHELNKLKTCLNEEIQAARSELRRRDYLQKRQTFIGLAETQCYSLNIETNKENETPEIVPLKEINQNEQKSEDFVIESPNTMAFFENCHSPPLVGTNYTSTSPKLNKNSFNNYKKKNLGTPSLLQYPVITHKVEKTPKYERKSDELKALQNCDDSNIMECSIIENTPDLKPKKKTRNYKLSLLKSNKKAKLSQSKQKSTLTQMFLESKKKKKKEIDSDGSSMSINAMLELINQSSGSETDDGLDKTDTTVDNLEAIAVKQTPLDKDVDVSLNFIEEYDKIPEKKQEGPNFVYHEVIRGKERNKLKGWACTECKDYYEGLNLPPVELEKKKNQCSRHRHQFQPRDETYKGFWDLTFGPSPKSPNEPMIVNHKRK